jgi:hypothetical protein
LYTRPKDQEFIYTLNDDLDGEEFEDVVSGEIFEKLVNLIRGKTLEEIFNIVLFHTYRPICIHNESGYDQDHRGSDHYGIVAKWADTKLLPKGDVTFGQWTEALFTLKSHKTDIWYEMYGSSTVENDRLYQKVTLVFDHGS